jgi:hypothetical protein
MNVTTLVLVIVMMVLGVLYMQRRRDRLSREDEA